MYAPLQELRRGGALLSQLRRSSVTSSASVITSMSPPAVDVCFTSAVPQPRSPFSEQRRRRSAFASRRQILAQALTEPVDAGHARAVEVVPIFGLATAGVSYPA
jgi:hypothetical protein